MGRIDIFIHRFTGDDWSPEAREAAARARASQAHHLEHAAHHTNEATGRGESLGKPSHGSHAEAASHHNSAAFYHGKTAEHHESGNAKEAEEYGKKASRQSSVANSATKKIVSGKHEYPGEKENNWQGQKATTQAERGARYLAQRHVGLIKR